MQGLDFVSTSRIYRRHNTVIKIWRSLTKTGWSLVNCVYQFAKTIITLPLLYIQWTKFSLDRQCLVRFFDYFFLFFDKDAAWISGMVLDARIQTDRQTNWRTTRRGLSFACDIWRCINAFWLIITDCLALVAEMRCFSRIFVANGRHRTRLSCIYDKLQKMLTKTCYRKHDIGTLTGDFWSG